VQNDRQRFPVIQEQFDQLMDASMEEEYNVAEEGGTERNPKGYYIDGNEYIWIYAAAQEEVDAVRKLVESAENRFQLMLRVLYLNMVMLIPVSALWLNVD